MVIGPDGKPRPLKVGSHAVKKGQTEAECQRIRDQVSECGFSKIKFVMGQKSEVNALLHLIEQLKHPQLHSSQRAKMANDKEKLAWDAARKVHLQLCGPCMTFFVNNARSHAQNQMRLVALQCLQQNNKTKLPTMQLIHKILDRTIDVTTNNNKELVVWWVTEMLPKATANAKLFDHKKAKCQTINNAETLIAHVNVTMQDMPASTEAFAVVMHDNCKKKWERWHNWRLEEDNKGFEPHAIQAKKPGITITAPKHCKKPRKVVCVEDDEDFGTKCSVPDCGQLVHGGWSKKGLEEYHRLMKLNKQSRSKKAGRAKENEFVSIIKENFGLTANSWEEEEANKKKRKTSLVAVEEELELDDFFDLEEIPDEPSDVEEQS